MKSRKWFILFICLSVLCSVILPSAVWAGEAAKTSGKTSGRSAEVRPGTWAAVDGLGRTVSSAEQVGARDPEKFVGCFYWIWHTYFSSYPARNITNIIDRYPEARNDYDHKAWRSTAEYTPYFWDEPLFGYYRTSDEYVLRKHAELLADADVDVIIFDCSNGDLTFKTGYDKVFKVFDQARKDGVDVPQIAFLLNFFEPDQSAVQLTRLYKDIYEKGRYSDLWFYWEGKPLVMACSDGLDLKDETAKTVAQFFTFRQNEPTYFLKDTAYEDKIWGWCSVYPQTKFGVRGDGSVEQICVSVAQNANDYGLCAMNDYRGGVYGRGYAKGDYSYSYTYKNKTVTINKDTENAYFYGLNFQQQWDYALKVDPDFIFITGWNEYVVQRMREWYHTPNAFSDNFNAEYSRDVEPSAGVLKDYFYYQMVENIRRFKGTDVQESASALNHAYKTIDIESDTDPWADVSLSYDHYIGSTVSRNAAGYQGTNYKSDTMRNDIVTAKVAYDDENLYFMVETLEDLTPSSDPAWMRLLIDTDPTGISANWEGFEYILNRTSPSGSEAVIEASTGGWNFRKVGTAKIRVSANRLQLAVPREALGLAGLEQLSFNFKWADNTRADGAHEDSGDILDFYQYGDVAPGARFMFTFTTEEVTLPPATPTPTTPTPATPTPAETPTTSAPALEDPVPKGSINPWIVVMVVLVIVGAAVAIAVVLILRKKK